MIRLPTTNKWENSSSLGENWLEKGGVNDPMLSETAGRGQEKKNERKNDRGNREHKQRKTWTSTLQCSELIACTGVGTKWNWWCLWGGPKQRPRLTRSGTLGAFVAIEPDWNQNELILLIQIHVPLCLGCPALQWQLAHNIERVAYEVNCSLQFCLFEAWSLSQLVNSNLKCAVRGKLLELIGPLALLPLITNWNCHLLLQWSWITLCSHL